ncbi:energy transducer TonB [Flavobacterium agrisoli]|uniref:Energy transducer TonB n=1 Tax=Flavobacterium agrisoli TaxID=2793066 RepID=A0A934PPS5_9FLAO|nr:energy transducer TonB [Flavobacterium agrisoli]MBK0370820.1 energy transducer TonB [Flavobacterium agrisoli]
MSKLSIYENSWNELVFENRNKEYGAYQLRHDNSKTAFTALFMGLLFSASIVAILFYISKIKSPSPDMSPTEIPTIDRVIEFSKVHTNQLKQPVTPPTVASAKTAAPAPIVEKSQLVNPVVVPSTDVTQEIAKNIENNIPTTASIESVGTGSGISAGTSSGTGNGTDSSGKSDLDSAIVNSGVLDVKPTFPGGIEKFYKYVGTNFRQPELDSDQIFKVYVSFVIEKDGSLTQIKVLQDPGYGLGKEAIRVLQSLKTKWNPGIINNKPVRTAYNLPITVKAP